MSQEVPKLFYLVTDLRSFMCVIDALRDREVDLVSIPPEQLTETLFKSERFKREWEALTQTNVCLCSNCIDWMKSRIKFQ